MTADYMRAFVEGIEPAFRRGDSTVENKVAETENVQVLREFYRAIARGDLATAASYFHDDMDLEITGPPSLPILGRWRGRDEVAAAVVSNFAMLKDQRPEIRSLIAQGDGVVVFGHEEGVFVATDASYAVHWVQVYRFRDGRIAHLHEIVDGYSVADREPVARA
jgi:ketosteroid isomerase-like protein